MISQQPEGSSCSQYRSPESQTTGSILSRLQAAGLTVKPVTVDYSDYNRWFNSAEYDSRYPKYVEEFPKGVALSQKSLQHYLSIKLLSPSRHSVVMDVASSNSPFPDILRKSEQVGQVFRQDLNYPSGIQGNRIGCNAIHIPLPSESIDYITLHCSWEHFEGNGDVLFLREAIRLLRSGGGVCIIPLYLASQQTIFTSPSVWESKYVNAKDKPEFDSRAIVCIDEDRKQRHAKLYSPECLADSLHTLNSMATFSIIHFENSSVISGCPVFALTCFRK